MIQKITLSTILCFLVSCNRPGDFQAGKIQLGLNFIAKNMCSCLWVSNYDEKHCLDFVQLKQVNPSIKILNDTKSDEKSIEASFFWIKQGRASFIDSKRGCRIE